MYCLVCCQDCTRYCVSTLLLASIATLWQLQWIKGYYNYRELIIKFSSRNPAATPEFQTQYICPRECKVSTLFLVSRLVLAIFKNFR